MEEKQRSVKTECNGWPKGWLVRSTISEKPRRVPQLMELPQIFTSRDEAERYFDERVRKLKDEMNLKDDFKSSGVSVMAGDDDVSVMVRIEDAYLATLIYFNQVVKVPNPDGTFRYAFKLEDYVQSTSC